MKFFRPSVLRSGDPEPAAGDTPAEPASPPPAASVVLNSDAQEGDAAEIVRLKRELDEEKAGRKKDQIRVSELEDENHRLKNPAPKPNPAAQQKKSFLEGATFFG